ncbi:pyrophosphatase PpaX [Clostridium magnum]|uniref:Pyrophosphatase PpaX n=1 Tax=Clostridium magnum DSM 2767 TaxID=1121326 RepID=A0A161XA19_9CLOT|nr:pyrophosphatase PpaX [Clostridium magnum]KZL91106.1 pyrophosphatase PpaX [Clostridium magnum DSM 2767]SHI18232.1 pyrophosphatase PpaX [Clostridium magnum DSM 2767]
MIKGILFDLDGTLINTNKLIIDSFQYALKKHLNKEVPLEEIVTTFGEPLEETMAKFDKDNRDLLVSIYRDYNETNHDKFAIKFEGVESGLKALKALGIKLAIVTSKRRILADRGLKLINIYDYMDVIVTPEDTEKHKPQGEPAEKACELLGILPEEAIMVGDSHNDILCGRNAGCSTCLVQYTALPIDKLMTYKPNYVIEKIEDLVEVCNSINRQAI